MIYKLFLVICLAQSYFFYFHFQNFYYQKKLTIAQKRAENVNKHSMFHNTINIFFNMTTAVQKG